MTTKSKQEKLIRRCGVRSCSQPLSAKTKGGRDGYYLNRLLDAWTKRFKGQIDINHSRLLLCDGHETQFLAFCAKRARSRKPSAPRRPRRPSGTSKLPIGVASQTQGEDLAGRSTRDQDPAWSEMERKMARKEPSARVAAAAEAIPADSSAEGSQN